MKHIVNLFAFALMISSGAAGYASDLDDGISKYTDGSIAGESKMGGKIVNSGFITLKSRAMSQQAKKNKNCQSLAGYGNVQGSVVITDPNAAKNIRTIINVQDSKGQSQPMGCS